MGSLSPASCLSWTGLASRAGPLGPQWLAVSTRLQSGWQAHGRPLPQFHSGLCASVPPDGLARLRPRLCQGKMGMCGSRREGGLKQVPRWLARPGPSTQLMGAGRRGSRACAHDMPGDKDIFSWLAACSSDPASPMPGVPGGWQAPRSSSLAQDELFVNVMDHVSTGRGTSEHSAPD